MSTICMATLVSPRLVTLDTSHYAQIAKDITSRSTDRRDAANSFLREMANKGYILIFSFSHLEELLRNDSDEVVSDCLSFLSSISFAGWIAGYNTPTTVGSIVDILSFEAKAALDAPNASPFDIREMVKKRVFQFGSGRDLVEPLLEAWPILRAWLRQRNTSTRETAAIYRSGFAGKSNAKVKDLLELPRRTVSDAESRLQSLESALEIDIEARGDRRIASPLEVSRRFFVNVRREASHIFENSVHPVIQLLQLHDIELDELDDDATIEDIGHIATFRSKLKIANQNLGVSWHLLKKVVSEKRVPSGIIQTGLCRFSQDANERKGSDLGDMYLACIAPYADVTYVDKRTLENFFRARRKQPNFARIISRVERAGHYALIPSQLDHLFTCAKS